MLSSKLEYDHIYFFVVILSFYILFHVLEVLVVVLVKLLFADPAYHHQRPGSFGRFDPSSELPQAVQPFAVLIRIILLNAVIEFSGGKEEVEIIALSRPAYRMHNVL